LNGEIADAEVLRERHPVVAGVGLVVVREPGRVLREVEGAAVDDGAADRGAVAAEVLRRGVHDDVGAVLERPDEVRRRDRVVHDERHARGVGDPRDPRDVEHVDQRVGDRLGVERLGVRLRGRAPLLEVVGLVDERDGDPHFRERVVEQVVGAAVEP
jgi:hypothetical protein